ncbi:L-Ala-D/L-Glu epimerase [compost metagenome]
MRLRAVPYEVPFRRPIQTAHGTLLSRKGFWVLAEEGPALRGLGEVAPLPEWGTETLAEAEHALASLSTLDLPTDAEGLGQRLASLGLNRDRLPATLAGIELACLDLLARETGVSLASILTPSGVPLERVPANALLVSREPEELAAEARMRVRQGFGTLKVKVGVGAIADDVARIRAVRDAVGPLIRLRADANGAWDLSTADAALRALMPFDLQYLEQPVMDPEALATLHERAYLPLAADESAQDSHVVERLLERRSVDWLILKPMALGGLRYTRELVQKAREAGIGVTLTSVLDRGVGTAGALHLAAALGLDSACGLSNTHMDAPHFVGPMPEGGELMIRSPGHGLAIDRAIASPEGTP